MDFGQKIARESYDATEMGEAYKVRHTELLDEAGFTGLRTPAETGGSNFVVWKKPTSEGPPSSRTPRIVSTAIDAGNGNLVTGEKWNAEHRDFTQKAIEQNPDIVDDLLSPESTRRGFIVEDADGTRRFVGRKEAYEIAGESGQRATENSKGELNSQDLAPEPPVERKLGPGAANIEEFTPQEPVGAWNAKVDEQRAARGLEPLASEARKADEVTWDAAERRMTENTDYAPDLVDAINKGKKESVSDTEQAALLREMIRLREIRDQATNRAFDEQTYSPKERAEFLQESKDAEERLERTEEADRKSGTAQGRALRIRRLMAYEDFTLAGLMGKARRAKGGEDVTPAESADLKKKAERFKKAKDEFEAREEEAEVNQPIDEAIKAIEAEASKDPEFTPEVKGLADRIVAKLERAAKGSSERIRALMSQIGSQLGSGPDVVAGVKLVKELAVRAAVEISRVGLKSTLKFTRWASKMVSEFGKGIEPYLDSAWKKANTDIDDQVAGTRTKKPKEVKAAITKETAGAEVEKIGTGMKEKMGKGEKLSSMKGDIQKLVESLVRGGLTGKTEAEKRNSLVDAVHDVLKGADPSITRRQTADAISGYGDFKPLNRDAVKTEVRDLKQQLQLVSKIDDIEGKIPLAKSGVERQRLSDESRRLTSELNEAIKKHGVVVSDPATQLRTMRAAQETRLTNRIKDLRAEIAAGERRVKTKTDKPTSEMVEALKKELAEVEAEHEATFGKREMTPEQKTKAALASARRAETSELARLEKAKKGIFDKPVKTPAAKNAELEAIKARTEALREERKALEEAARPPVSKAQKALDTAMVERERLDQVLAGEIAPAKKVSKEALTDLETDVRAEIAAMRELAAEIRRDAKPKTDPEAAKEEAAVKALEKAAAEYERRLNEADFSGPGKRQGPDTARVAKARALRDAARAALDAARKLAHPPRTKDQIALQNYKAMAARKMAELQDRIARDDFAPRTRKPALDLSKDPEAVKAFAEMQRVRKEFNEKKFAWERANRTMVRKVWDGIKETAAMSRSLITSADVSAPFRQGGFLLMGDLVFHPVRAAKQIGSMFRQLVSEKAFEKAQAEIMLRPNAKNGLYNQSDLYLADLNDKLSGREESMRSTLAEKIPIIGRLVRGSNRAYSGFLNRQRVDSFDAMVEAFGGPDKITPAEAKAIADFVNKATGRGTVGGMERSADALARYFFSPRFLASRFQLVLGQPLMKGSGKKVIAQQYAKFAIGLAAIYGLAALNGSKLEKDPRSADFGKMRFGNTRIDPLAGMAQVTTFLARQISGKTKSKGQVKDANRGDVFVRFGRTKLAPIPAVIADFAAEKTMDFKKPTALGTVQKLTVPLSYQDMPAVYKEHGAVKGTILEVLNLLGQGLQHYD